MRKSFYEKSDNYMYEGNPMLSIYFTQKHTVVKQYWTWVDAHQYSTPTNFPEPVLEAVVLVFNRFIEHKVNVEINILLPITK